jgi:hypothetical protein
MIKNKRGAIEFSFGWIFAIIAGMFILFLAIYGVTKFINLEKTSISAQTSMDIGVLTNPLESSFETVKRGMITTPSETRIYTNCSNTTFFGRQTIRTSQKTYNAWGEDMVNVNFQNKYIFSESPADGKKFYLFSKPFEFPFKVADLMYLTSTADKYCFINAPIDIQGEIKDLKGTTESPDENLFINTSADNSCPEGSINICFGTRSNSCNIFVYRSSNSNYVEKDGKLMYYEGDALMYAAIFSEPDYYECEVGRLMNRTEELYDIYKDKSDFISQKDGCSQELNVDLIVFGNMIKNFKDSKDLSTIYILADSINTEDKYMSGSGECRLW